MHVLIIVLMSRLTDVLFWFFDKLTDKAYKIFIASALSSLAFGAVYGIVNLIRFHPVPDSVITILSIVAPADWAYQIITILSIKGVSLAYYQMKMFMEEL